MEIESRFRLPKLSLTVEAVEAHFESEFAAEAPPLTNYHREDPVPEETRRDATQAAVLIPIINDADELRILLTRRHHEISYPGHVCFPGGRADPRDTGARMTALREAHEETGLDPAQVRVLGELGRYTTQTGFCVTPVVGIVERPLSLRPDPREVSEILELPLDVATRSDSYQLWQPDPDRHEAYFSLRDGDVMLTGPTVCLMMGFYENLAATQAPAHDADSGATSSGTG